MLNKLVLIVIFLFVVNLTFAQETPIVVKRSTEKVFENGKKYYLHTVQKGETLYSISKAYNVDAKDIATENANVVDGIQPNKTLKIPIIVGKNSTEEEILSSGKFIVHKVEPQQTLYSISKQYETTVAIIQELNPEVVNGVKIGQLLRIPKKEETVTAKPVVAKNSNDCILHTVEKSQTLYSISKKYNVEVDAILKENPEVAKDGLKVDGVIKIPKSKKQTIENETIEETKTVSKNPVVIKSTNDTIAKKATEIKATTISSQPIKNRAINISLFLPFHADRNKLIDIDAVTKGSDAFFPNSSFVSFYEGVLLAIDSLRREGISVNLNVYDTENDSAKIVKLLSNPVLKKSDLLVGPSYLDEFKMVSDFAKQNRIPIVSPFLSKKEILDENPFVFQVIPSLPTQLNLSVIKVFETYKNKNLIFITNKNIENDKIAQLYRKTLDSLAKISGKTLKVVSSSYFSLSQIEPSLSQTEENILFVPSNDQVYVSNIVSSIGIYGKKYNISMIGLPSWKKYDNIELEYYHRVNLHVFQPVFVDFSETITKNFIKEAHFLFKNEPNEPFAYIGFDVINYFTKALYQFGPSFTNNLSNFKKSGICIDFNFEKKSANDGFENSSVKVVKYNNEFDIVPFNTDL